MVIKDFLGLLTRKDIKEFLNEINSQILYIVEVLILISKKENRGTNFWILEYKS